MPFQTFTAEDLNATNILLTFRNLAADTLTFTIPLASLASTAEIVPGLGQVVSLYRAGVQIFKGHVTGRRQTGREMHLTVSGPWWWLERIFLESQQTSATGATAQRPTYAFSAQSLTDSVRAILNKAVALGVPLAVGSLATTFLAPPMRVNQTSYAETLADLVRVTPDMVVYFDYDGAVPVLNTQRRLYAAGLTLDARKLENFELNPLTELEVREVSVPYMAVDALGKKQFAAQVAGADALGKRYIHIVSGAEMDTFLPPDATSTPGSTVNAKTMGAKITNELVKKFNPYIGGLASYGASIGGVKQGPKIWIGSNIKPRLLAPGVRQSVHVQGNVNINVTLTGKSVLLSNNLPDWAIQKLKGQKVTYNGTWYAYWPISDPTAHNQLATAPEWFKKLAVGADAIGNGWGAKPSIANWGNPPGYIWVYRYWTFSAILVKGKVATDPPVLRGADYAFRFPPAGFAAGLLGAQNYVPHEGGFTVVADDAGAVRHMVYAINFSGSQAAHASIRAMVTEEEIEVATGKTKVRLGQPARFSYRELVNRVRTNANDQITYL